MKEILGELKFSEQKFVPKAFKIEKPKAEKVEKVEKAEPKPKKEDEEEDEPKEEKKPVVKYSYTFDLNAWKRHYKNLDWDTEDW